MNDLNFYNDSIGKISNHEKAGRYAEADALINEVRVKVAQQMANEGWVEAFGRGLANTGNAIGIGVKNFFGGQQGYKEVLPQEIEEMIQRFKSNESFKNFYPANYSQVLNILRQALVEAKKAINPATLSNPAQNAFILQGIGQQPAKAPAKATAKANIQPNYKKVYAQEETTLVGSIQRTLRDFANRNKQKFANDPTLFPVLQLLDNAYRASLVNLKQVQDPTALQNLSAAEKQRLGQIFNLIKSKGRNPEEIASKLESGDYPASDKKLAPLIRSYYRQWLQQPPRQPGATT